MATEQDSECGFLYVAFGVKHIREALRSAVSLRHWCPTAAIALITDQCIGRSVFDQIITLPTPEKEAQGNYHLKIGGMRLSPFQRTIFLDTDTLVCADLTNLFPLLDQFDMLVTHNAWRVDRAFEDHDKPYSDVPTPFMSCNTGFLGFAASPPVETLLVKWAERMQLQIEKYGETNDQPAFRWALFHSNARFCVLSNAHNYHAHNPFMLPGHQALAVLHDRRPFMDWFAKVNNVHSRVSSPRIVGRISFTLVAAFYCYSTTGFLRRVWQRLRRSS
jgi:hypothetical protein